MSLRRQNQGQFELIRTVETNYRGRGLRGKLADRKATALLENQLSPSGSSVSLNFSFLGFIAQSSTIVLCQTTMFQPVTDCMYDGGMELKICIA